MKLTARHIELIVINGLFAIAIIGALVNPPLAAAFVRVVVSLSPVLLTVDTSLIFKWLFRL